jgi:hypothetical protein
LPNTGYFDASAMALYVHSWSVEGSHVKILKAASQAGTLLWAIPAGMALLVAGDLLQEVRFRRWARQCRRRQTGRYTREELRFAYFAGRGTADGPGVSRAETPANASSRKSFA